MSTTSKTVSILRDKWRHNRKLMDTLRYPRRAPTGLPPEHARGWDKEKSGERPQQHVNEKDFVSNR